MTAQDSVASHESSSVWSSVLLMQLVHSEVPTVLFECSDCGFKACSLCLHCGSHFLSKLPHQESVQITVPEINSKLEQARGLTMKLLNIQTRND
jgi:hypothetical protein